MILIKTHQNCIGVIIMHCVLRPYNDFSIRQISDSVMSSLEIVHAAGVKHTDLRESNMLYFPEIDCVQLIDYDNCGIDDEGCCTSNVEIVVQSTRHFCCGTRVLLHLQGEESGEQCVIKNWSAADDFAMLINLLLSRVNICHNRGVLASKLGDFK